MNITRKGLLLLLPLLAALARAHQEPIPLKFAAPGTENSNEMICHPGRECYPRVFQPTDEFRVIEDDQEVPAGLHIRMDVATGQRQAKINIPSADDHIHDAVVVHTSENESEPESELPKDVPKEVPLHQRKIKPPKHAEGDRGVFNDSVAALLKEGAGDALASALEDLEELSHEAYWGAQLTAAPGAVDALLKQLSSAAADTRAHAALVLGSALSNNPKALAHAAETELVAPVLAALRSEKDEAAKKRILFLLGQTLRDSDVRDKFLQQQGAKTLTDVFHEGSPAVQGRVAVVVEDAFLNKDMRAEGSGEGESKHEAALKGLCEPFAHGVVELAAKEVDEAVKVLSALSALKNRFGCETGTRFGEWVEGFLGEGELGDGAKAWLNGQNAQAKSEL
jgi:nucleotide exchange factor SIL1